MTIWKVGGHKLKWKAEPGKSGIKEHFGGAEGLFFFFFKRNMNMAF